MARPTRRALIGWSAFAWVPALVAGGLLLGMTLSANSAVADYREGADGHGSEAFAWLSQWAPMEQWKAPYDEGTARLADNQSPRLALYSLDVALVSVPDSARCDVQTNRTEALARIGDEEMAEAGDHATWVAELSRLRGTGEALPEDPPWGTNILSELIATGQRLAEQAAQHYQEAADALLDPTCTDQRSDEEQQEAEQRADELDQQSEDASGLGDQMDPTQPPESQDQSEEEQQQQQQQEEQQRQQDLQDRNDQAQEDPDQGGNAGGGGGGVDRPW